MKVLIALAETSMERVVIRLSNNGIVQRIKTLVGDNRRKKAIITALTNGIFESGHSDMHVHNTDADLVLSRDGAHWDLC